MDKKGEISPTDLLRNQLERTGAFGVCGGHIDNVGHASITRADLPKDSVVVKRKME